MNYYEELEVSKNASQEIIRAAYKSLIQRYHPDKHNGSTHERLERINAAYKVLSNPEAKELYDKSFFGPSKEKSPSHKPPIRELPSNQKKKTQEPPKNRAGNLLLIASLVAAFALSAYYIARQMKAEEEARKVLAELSAKREKEDSLKKEKERIEKEKFDRDDLARRTSKIFSGYHSVELINSNPTQCAILAKVIEIPPITIVIGKWDSHKVKSSYLSAVNLIAYKIEEEFKSMSACDLVQVDISGKIEDSIKKISNNTLFGEKQGYADCRTMRRLSDGSYVIPIFDTDEDEYVCRGIEKVTLEAPVQAR